MLKRVQDPFGRVVSGWGKGLLGATSDLCMSNSPETHSCLILADATQLWVTPRLSGQNLAQANVRRGPDEPPLSGQNLAQVEPPRFVGTQH